MDPLNYASVDLSLNDFDGGLAKQRINWPIKIYVAEIHLICSSFLLIQFDFLMPYNA
jgi:hypothetical protein